MTLFYSTSSTRYALSLNKEVLRLLFLSVTTLKIKLSVIRTLGSYGLRSQTLVAGSRFCKSVFKDESEPSKLEKQDQSGSSLTHFWWYNSKMTKLIIRVSFNGNVCVGLFTN